MALTAVALTFNIEFREPKEKRAYPIKSSLTVVATASELANLQNYESKEELDVLHFDLQDGNHLTFYHAKVEDSYPYKDSKRNVIGRTFNVTAEKFTVNPPN